MGLRDRLRRLSAGTPELHRERLGRHYEGLAATPIAEAPLRVRTTIAGEITSIRVVPRAGSPSLEVNVSDGSGTAVGIFTGRRSIPGITPGRGVLLDGVARRERNRLVLQNPGYRLL